MDVEWILWIFIDLCIYFLMKIPCGKKINKIFRSNRKIELNSFYLFFLNLYERKVRFNVSTLEWAKHVFRDFFL